MKKLIKGKNLAVFLAIGESLNDFQKKGQLQRLLYNIRYYLKEFDSVYIFSYKNERIKLPKNCVLVANKYNVHRYVYALLMPFLQRASLSKCTTVRALQLTGGIPALICKMFFNKPYVINYGYDYEYYARIDGKNLHAVLYKILKYPILTNSTYVIYTTQSLKKSLNFLNRGKLIFLPNGVDLKLFKKKRSKNSNIRKIIYIGRLEEQKNLVNLVKACTKLSFAYKLELFGEGKLKTVLKVLADNLKVNLELGKPIKYTNVPVVLNSADVFALPSAIEGNPKILLEAMACECNIVATNVPGIAELITDNQSGYLSKTDAASLADSLKKAFLSKKNTGASARQFIEKNYNIDVLLQKETKLIATIK